MVKENSTNQTEDRFLDGQMNIVLSFLSILAFRAGLAEEMDSILDILVEEFLQENEGETESQESFRKGADAAISYIKDFLRKLGNIDSSEGTDEAAKRFRIQVSHEDMFANTLVTQIALAFLINRLGFSIRIREDLGVAKINIAPKDSTHSDATVPVEVTEEIQNALTQFQGILDQTMGQRS